MRALALVHEGVIGEGLEYAVATAQAASPTLARQRIAGKIIKALPDAEARPPGRPPPPSPHHPETTPHRLTTRHG